MPPITTSGIPRAAASRATRTLRSHPPRLFRRRSAAAPPGGQRSNDLVTDPDSVHVGEVHEHGGVRARATGAASSAFTLTDSLLGPEETGEIIGRKPAAQSIRTGAGSTRSGCPLGPVGVRRARMSPPSRPDNPIADTSTAVSPAASALLTTPTGPSRPPPWPPARFRAGRPRIDSMPSARSRRRHSACRRARAPSGPRLTSPRQRLEQSPVFEGRPADRRPARPGFGHRHRPPLILIHRNASEARLDQRHCIRCIAHVGEGVRFRELLRDSPAAHR